VARALSAPGGSGPDHPTFYAIDRDGTVRFAGPFDLAQAKAMAAALVAEPPGAPKRMFSPPMPAIGALPGAFTGTTLGGENVALSDLLGPRATLLFFGATTCPFSKQATLTLPRLAAAFAAKGAAIAIIDQGEQTEDIRAFYAGQQVPVIVDADNRISLGAFGVWAVPYFFVLDAQGKVVDRQPYTEAAGTTALAGALGLTTGVTLPQAGAG
jgi:peroxiredoxin